MEFQKIDRSTWRREEYYRHYFSDLPCTYSAAVRLDITRLREQKQSLYPTMLYLIATVVNRHDEFRTALNGAGELGVYDQLMPCYTVFHKHSETFSNIWTEYSTDYKTFCAAYERDIEAYGSVERMEAKPETPQNTFPISMIPWLSFGGFHLNLQKGYDYLLPIFTMGKFEMVDGCCLLPLSVQVHHAVCDGFHLSRFVNELQGLLDCFS